MIPSTDNRLPTTVLPRRRDLVFLLAAFLAAALFARLGLWQVQRLRDRRAHNAVAESRLRARPVSVGTVPRDSAAAHYRRVNLTGTYDFGHEVVIVNRVHEGSPGVHIITPVRPDSGFEGDTVVLVDRGWVYSPDGAMVDLSGWHEPEHVVGTGYLQTFPGHALGPSAVPGRANHLHWLDAAYFARADPPLFAIAPFYVVLESKPGEASRHVPARDPLPTLDDGPHLSYAIQWFVFAVIAIGGAFFAVFFRARSPRPGLEK